MKTILSKTSPYLFYLLVLVFTSSCHFPGESQADLQVPDQIPDADNFMLQDVKIEEDIPADQDNFDFMLEFHIHRINMVSTEGGDISQEDLASIDVVGFGDELYGETSEGQQTLIVVYEGSCILAYAGIVGYIIHKFLSNDCLLILELTQAGEAIHCTSSCVSDPGYTFQWYTDVGEHHLDPIIVSFSELDEGYTRTENLGDMN